MDCRGDNPVIDLHAEGGEREVRVLREELPALGGPLLRRPPHLPEEGKLLRGIDRGHEVGHRKRLHRVHFRGFYRNTACRAVRDWGEREGQVLFNVKR